jgi:hypothetical protein
MIGMIVVVVVAVDRAEKVVGVLCVLIRSRHWLYVGGKKLYVRGVRSVVRVGVMIRVLLLLLMVGSRLGGVV